MPTQRQAEKPRPLTDKRLQFVIGVARGMNPTSAARAAGFKFPSTEGPNLLKQPYLQEAVAKERAKIEKAADVTRKEVIDGLKEAIDIAKTNAEPASMVAGWREIARICGYYAPETKRVEINVAGAIHISQVEQLSDEELSNLVLEGQSVVIDEEQLQLEDKLGSGTTDG